jgi:hypothetical protein
MSEIKLFVTLSSWNNAQIINKLTRIIPKNKNKENFTRVKKKTEGTATFVLDLYKAVKRDKLTFREHFKTLFLPLPLPLKNIDCCLEETLPHPPFLQRQDRKTMHHIHPYGYSGYTPVAPTPPPKLTCNKRTHAFTCLYSMIIYHRQR